MSLHVDDAVESLSSILLESGLYEPIGQYIAVLTDNKKGFYDFSETLKVLQKKLFWKLQMIQIKIVNLLLSIIKERQELMVFNLTGICSLRIREPSENSCTELRQIIGRATRLCTGHGKLLHEKYNYNFEKILREYCKDNPNVNKKVFSKLLITSAFRFDYPSTPAGHWDLSVTEFERDYAPTWDSVKDVVRSLIFDEESALNVH